MHELKRTYRFEAAHRLPRVSLDHPCHRMHGHSYRLDIQVTGEPDSELGWVLDYAVIDTAIEPLIQQLDHQCLNDIGGLENPTSEILAEWVWARAYSDLPGLSAVAVWETVDACAIYRGPQ